MNAAKGIEKRKPKVDKIVELKDSAKSIIFAQYHGLSANKLNDLRAKLKLVGAKAQIAKNTFLKIATDNINEAGQEIKKNLKGPTIAVYSQKDPFAAIKVLFDFAAQNELPKIKAGIVEGKYTDYNQLEELSKLPTKDTLISRFMGSIKSPVSKLAYALAQVASKKEAN